jgi:hypothetical protein
MKRTARKFSLAQHSHLRFSCSFLDVFEYHLLDLRCSISCFGRWKNLRIRKRREKEEEAEEENRIFRHRQKTITTINCIDNHLRKTCIFYIIKPMGKFFAFNNRKYFFVYQKMENNCTYQLNLYHDN